MKQAKPMKPATPQARKGSARRRSGPPDGARPGGGFGTDPDEPDLTPESESEALAQLRRHLEARLAELRSSPDSGRSDAPIDLPTLRAKLAANLRRMSLCDHARCQRAGECRQRRKDCPWIEGPAAD